MFLFLAILKAYIAASTTLALPFNEASEHSVKSTLHTRSLKSLSSLSNSRNENGSNWGTLAFIYYFSNFLRSLFSVREYLQALKCWRYCRYSINGCVIVIFAQLIGKSFTQASVSYRGGSPGISPPPQTSDLPPPPPKLISLHKLFKYSNTPITV